METRKKFANSTVVKDIVKLLFIVYCLLFFWVKNVIFSGGVQIRTGNNLPLRIHCEKCCGSSIFLSLFLFYI